MLSHGDIFSVWLFCFILFFKKHYRIVNVVFSSREGRNTLLPVSGVCHPSQGTLKAWDGLLASWPPGSPSVPWKPEHRAGAGFVFLLMLRERWVSELFRLRLQQSQTMEA